MTPARETTDKMDIEPEKALLIELDTIIIARAYNSDHQCSKLLWLAEICNPAVVITNKVQSNPSQEFGDPNRPAGGHIMAHACTHGIHLYKESQGTRVAKVIDSPYLREETARFLITERGVEDAPREVERRRNFDVPED